MDEVATHPEHGGAPAAGALSGAVVGLLALTGGVAVANLYYAQPLLHMIGASFGAGYRASSLVVTIAQAGFAFGLFFVVPLGDLLDRRRLLLGLLVLAALADGLAAAAPSLPLLYGALALSGLGSVAAQVSVPLAADLATPERRGRVVGAVMSGLIVGILLARTLAGLVAEAASWRAVYGLGAGLCALLAVVLGARLGPSPAPNTSVGYRDLIVSTVRIFAEERELRLRSALGACSFGCFNILWSTISFLLTGAPYRFSTAEIGLFALLGVAGALGARLAGRLADAGHAPAAACALAGLLVASLVLAGLGRAQLALVVVGVFVLDAAAQGIQITNLARIYRLRPDARSRLNATYMTTFFLGGAAGSAAAGALYGHGGFLATSLLGAGVGAIGLAIALAGLQGDRRARRGARAAAP